MIRICVVLDLEEAGFSVLDAADAQEALRVFGDHPEIAILFTDINMPGPFDGLALAHKIFKLRPGVQLIITSGRAEPPLREMPAGASFLPKPYTCKGLNVLIRADVGGREMSLPLPRCNKSRAIAEIFPADVGAAVFITS